MALDVSTPSTLEASAVVFPLVESAVAEAEDIDPANPRDCTPDSEGGTGESSNSSVGASEYASCGMSLKPAGKLSLVKYTKC